MYSKIRILVHQPVRKRLQEDFFIEQLEKENIDVLFYDLTEIFHSGLKIAGELSSEEIVKFKSLIDFDKVLSTERGQDILYIPYFIYEYKVLKVYKLLTKYNCTTAFMGRGALPSLNKDKSYLQIVLHEPYALFNRKFLVKGLRKVYAIFLKKVGLVKGFDIIFNAGKNGHYTCGTAFEILSSKKVPFNSTDYSRYLASLGQEKIQVSGKYAVFLDEYLPYHPDLEMFGLKSVEAHSYYSSLNAFFDTIEREQQIKIVVAAHPKSNYQSNPFDGRLLIKDKTECLIKDAEFVIDHFSTAISYAILNKKPLLLIYTNGIQEVFPNLVEYAKNISSILDASLINIDTDTNINVGMRINDEKYSTYKYDYLTMLEAEFKYDYEIFIDFLKGRDASQ